MLKGYQDEISLIIIEPKLAQKTSLNNMNEQPKQSENMGRESINLLHGE